MAHSLGKGLCAIFCWLEKKGRREFSRRKMCYKGEVTHSIRGGKETKLVKKFPLAKRRERGSNSYGEKGGALFNLAGRKGMNCVPSIIRGEEKKD